MLREKPTRSAGDVYLTKVEMAQLTKIFQKKMLTIRNDSNRSQDLPTYQARQRSAREKRYRAQPTYDTLLSNKLNLRCSQRCHQRSKIEAEKKKPEGMRSLRKPFRIDPAAIRSANGSHTHQLQKQDRSS